MEIQEEPLPLTMVSSPPGNNQTATTMDSNNRQGSDSESQDSLNKYCDPTRFNAYLNRGSELWTHWTWLGGQGKMSLMKCNYCQVNKQLKNAPKCRRHLIKCQKTPELIRKYFERKEIEASRVSAFMREIRSKEVKFPRNNLTTTGQDSNNKSNNHNHQNNKSDHNDQQPAQTRSKIPQPTANDLKHLHQKQHQQQQNNNSSSPSLIHQSSTILNGSTISSNHHHHNNNNSKSTKYSSSDLVNKTNVLMNYSPLINRSKSEHNGNNHNHHQSSSSKNQQHRDNHQQQSPNGGDATMMNDLSYNLLYQLMSMNPMSGNSPDAINVDNLASQNPILSSKLKRRLENLQQQNTGSNGKENNILENTLIKNKTPSINNLQNNTVVINLDDMSMDDSIYFDSLDNGHHDGESIMVNGGGVPNIGPRKKKRDNSYNNGNGCGITKYRNGGHDLTGSRNSNNNGYHHHMNEFINLDSNDIDIVHDDLNDLLMSALLSHGIEPNFVGNSYFQKFINQLVKFSTLNKNYRLPSVENLTTNNFGNLMRKFDYETAKVFAECDSIIVSFERINEDQTIIGQPMISKFFPNAIGKKNIKNSIVNRIGNNKNDKRLNVNLFVSTSNTCLSLFFKTISCPPKSSSSSSSSNDEIDVKVLNNQIDSLFSKLGPDQINAVILPYNDEKFSELIYAYLLSSHSHIVPLTNSYRLFHNLLCDICRIPSIHQLITKCIILFQSLETSTRYLFEFHQENLNHWKKVFDSDNLNIFKYFLTNNYSRNQTAATMELNNAYWISLNLMLCWFLVARSSIIKLFEKQDQDGDNNNDDEDEGYSSNISQKVLLTNIMQKSQLESSQLDSFFDQISILFNFLTPFINAMHLIENESTVISDIIKIYYDVKLAINNNNFFNGIGKVCDKTERQAIDSMLNSYLQENNFSRYFFLAYYLDPRFRDDRRIEENEELTAQVYDALFNYANSLGCVCNEEEDREKLIDSLEEFRNGDKLYGMQLLKCPKSPSKFWKHLRRFPGSAKLAYCASRLLSISAKSMLMTTPTDDPCTTFLHDKIIYSKSQMISDNPDELMFDGKDVSEKILPMKSYLLSSCQKIPINIENDSEDNLKFSSEKNGGNLMISNGDDDHHNNYINGNNNSNNNTICTSSSSTSSSMLLWNNSNNDGADGFGGSNNISKDNHNSTNICNIISNVITSLDQYILFIAQPFSNSDLSTFIQQPSN